MLLTVLLGENVAKRFSGWSSEGMLNNIQLTTVGHDQCIPIFRSWYHFDYNQAAKDGSIDLFNWMINKLDKIEQL